MKLCQLAQQHRRNDGYIKSTIYNAQRDCRRVLLRRYTGLLAIEEPEDGQAPAKWTISEEKLPAAEFSPEETLDRHALATRIFTRLSSEQQLVLAISLGLDGSDGTESPKTISRKTGISESRVESLLRSAKASMRAAAEEIQTVG